MRFSQASFLPVLVTLPPLSSRPVSSFHPCLSCDCLGGGEVCVRYATAIQVLATVWWSVEIPTWPVTLGSDGSPLSAHQLSSLRIYTNKFQPTIIPQVNVYQPCGSSMGDSRSLGMLQIGPIQRCVITGKGGNEYFVHWHSPTGQTCVSLVPLGHSHMFIFGFCTRSSLRLWIITSLCFSVSLSS